MCSKRCSTKNVLCHHEDCLPRQRWDELNWEQRNNANLLHNHWKYSRQNSCTYHLIVRVYVFVFQLHKVLISLALFCIWVKNFYVYLFEVTTMYQLKPLFVNSFNSDCRLWVVGWIYGFLNSKEFNVTRDSFIKRNSLRLFWMFYKHFTESTVISSMWKDLFKFDTKYVLVQVRM